MPDRVRSSFQGVALAVGAVVAAFLLREAVTVYLGPGLPTYITFYPAVMLGALFGGLVGGLVATGLSAFVSAYWLLPPQGLSIHSSVDVAGLVLFLLVGVLTSALAELYNRNSRKASEYAREFALREAQEQAEGALRRVNAVLADRNAELGRQAEELAQQAEELTQQKEELSEQSEELSQQNEELQAQSEEIHALNVELGHRETLLQMLLESARVSRTEVGALEDICTTTVRIFGGAADAVVVYEPDGDRLVVRAAAGGDGVPIPADSLPGTHAFADLIAATDRTACINDVSLRPDLPMLRLPGHHFSAVLGAPLHGASEKRGAVVVYSDQKQEWTAEQFRLTEWLAAQCSHILEILRLHRDLERRAALIDLSPDAIMVRRMDGTVLLWGRGAETLYGFTRTEAIGSSTHVLLKTRFPKPLEEIDAELARTGRWSGELVHVARDGHEVVVDSRWLAQRDDTGAIVELLESNVDVTARKASDRALREAEEKYRTLFTNMTEGFALGEALVDADGVARNFRFIEVNEAFERQTALPPSIVGKPITAVLPKLEPFWVNTYCHVALTGESARFDNYNADTNRHYEVFCYSPVRGKFAILFRDVTDQKRSQEALRRSEEQLRVATLAAEIGVWSWVPGTSEVAVSANWRRLFGIAPDARVTFETWRDALHPEDRERAVRELNAASEERREFDTEYRVVRTDGTIRWLVDRGRAWYDEAGQAIGMAGINIDITERKRAEEGLREVDRRKNEFLATLSHELRNPLAPIRYALQLIADDGPNAAGSHPKRVIERQLGHLVHLVDDLLDVTRIASNKVRLRLQRIDLASVIDHAVEATVPDVEQARHSLVVSLPPEPVWVDADADRLAQVLTNLLTNAARYTPAGGTIGLTVAPVEHEVVISVTDTGIGLSSDDLSRVFEMFAQVGEPGHGGLGIGLAIVKGLVELHGGHVEARSKGPGRGSEFRVRLPRAASGAAERVPRAGAAERDCRRRVLVVDDNGDAADMMKTFLELHGHDVRVAYDAASALAVVAEFHPEVGLFDIGLPNISGYDLARQVREDPANSRMFLVAVTGWGQEEDRQRARESGFDAHLTKPPDPDQVQRLIASRETAGK